jgi:glycerophosphoryl diester phosphodiesterase
MNTTSLMGKTLLSLLLFAPSEGRTAEPDVINFGDDGDITGRRPILIAHRGGVVSPRSPECSLTAMRLAAETGYDMVELDVQKSSDGVPIVLHDRTLAKACGKNGQSKDPVTTPRTRRDIPQRQHDAHDEGAAR